MFKQKFAIKPKLSQNFKQGKNIRKKQKYSKKSKEEIQILQQKEIKFTKSNKMWF